MPRVLVANRGEVAVRIARAARAEGHAVVGLRSADEPAAAHTRGCDDVVDLPGHGPQAYLDVDAVLGAAREANCDLLHPGYGLLSESPALARACEQAGVGFVGPSAAALETLGDKAACRDLAVSLELPVARACEPGDGEQLLADLGPDGAVMVKAVAGGGGRGIRRVPAGEDLGAALAQAASEADRAFGDGRVFVEEAVGHARHVEVQVAGDGEQVVALGTRDCSLQRRRQKVVEIAPAVHVPASVRRDLARAAARLVGALAYRGLATVEFLVTPERFVVMEVNPRLQVEHTVSEEVLGVDLVRAQLRLATGSDLAAAGLLGLTEQGCAIQARVGAEVVDHAGIALPTSGTLTRVELPTGPGVRVDTFVRTGVEVTGRWDPLLAKIVARGPDHASALGTLRAALTETTLDGLDTNVAWLRDLLARPEVARGDVTTTTVDTVAELLSADPVSSAELATDSRADVVSSDVVSPMAATVVSVNVRVGDHVTEGRTVAVLEAMKMEHLVTAPASGVVTDVAVQPGVTLREQHLLVRIDPTETADTSRETADEMDLDTIRDDLGHVIDRHALTLDENRPAAVERRHGTGHRTARENIADLVDPGSLREYGALAIAAQRARRDVDELRVATPADGIVTGTARISGAPVSVLAYDYTVLAGTQGALNHRKTDRMLGVARERRLPVVLFAEGGGGRPGDTDTSAVSGLDIETFSAMGALSGHVPSVGIATGRCFAGNAALLGCCDVVVATRDASIGMGGPAMIEGGGLGVFRPEEVGPTSVQVPNGVVDVLVEDEAEAVGVARRFVDLLTRRHRPGDAPDQRVLRHVVPENRKRVYDPGVLMETLCDTGTLLELRSGFGRAVRTGLARIDGMTVGVVANDPRHLGGAIDADAADKLTRFLQLCDAHEIPVVSLCDTPGFMVGPDAERTATVRHFARLFVVGARLRVPLATVIVRKGYGLGAMAMAGGSFRRPVATVAWPTGEVGAMGLEGAVRLGYRRELEAEADEQARRRLFDDLVARSYERGRATQAAEAVELDAVIDPIETRAWITGALGDHRPGHGERRTIDPW